MGKKIWNLCDKFLYYIALASMILSLSFGASGSTIAKAQGANTGTPTAVPVFQVRPTLLSSSSGDVNDAVSSPTFKLPWDSANNRKVLWTSGPHSWSRGGNFQTKIGITRGSGLDFAMGGQSFDVLAMAAGTVIKNKCDFTGLGCIVAIRHTADGSVMIYGHLKANVNGTAPLNELVEGNSYPQSYLVGYAGNTGGNWPVHLHIEYRDGASSCNAPVSRFDGNDCGDIGFAGNPVGWEGKKLVDNYYIAGYLSTPDSCGDPECDVIFNYDGSAVIGPILAPFLDFPYRDKKDNVSSNDILRKTGVMAYVHPNFFGPPPDYALPACASTTNCEINASDYTTVFAEQGLFQGGGGILFSTNSELQTSDTTPPIGSWTSPYNGQTISSRSVTLNINASDNAGGSGVKEARFSAAWGGQWRGIGNVSSSPYSINWDMCSFGVSDGDIELGFEVWDNANNKWVYSEHYTNIHINKSFNCTQPTNDTTPPTGSWTSPNNGQTISSQAVTLSVNASDNSGGSGVREVRWSAKWNNQWSGIGSDNTSSYSINWDMCASGVPDGDIELGMEVWDNANNKWVYSEHYTNYHINKSYNCANSSGDWETWGWQNKYLAGYDNWRGTVTWNNGYPYIWWDFGSNGPFGWGGNEFSLRMQKDVYFQGGDYSFHADHDDGVRVYIDGQLIIDAWWDGNGGHDGGRNLSQGYHQVKVEYYENQGDALIHVLWYGPGYPRPDNNPPEGRITLPANYSAISSSPLTISADASDDVSGVDRVEFYVWYCDATCAWRLIGTDYDAPYAISWNWSNLSDQHIYLSIHIFDRSGKVRDDAGGYVEVDLDRSNPAVSFTSPVSSTYLTTNTVPLQVSAWDTGSGVDKVVFYAGYTGSGDYWHEIGTDLDGSNGWQFSWDSSSLPDQAGVSFFVYSYDRAGNYSGASVSDEILDRTSPNSAVNGLPATEPTNFYVIWGGADNLSGIHRYNIQFQDNSGGWQDWILGTKATYAAFTGVTDHTYGFRSQSVDYAGNVEPWPASADASTLVWGTPVNDNVADAIPVSVLPFSAAQVTYNATIEANEPAYSCGNNNSASVWYSFTALSNGVYSFDTFGSDFDTVLHIYLTSNGTLNQIGCNDDFGSSQSKAVFVAKAGSNYLIGIASFGAGVGGNLIVNLSQTPCESTALCLVLKDHSGNAIYRAESRLFDGSGNSLATGYGDLAGLVKINPAPTGIAKTVVTGRGIFLIDNSIAGPGAFLRTNKDLPEVEFPIKDKDGTPITADMVLSFANNAYGWVGTSYSDNPLRVHVTPGIYDVAAVGSGNGYMISLAKQQLNSGQLSLNAAAMTLQPVQINTTNFSGGTFYGYAPFNNYWYGFSVTKGQVIYLATTQPSYTIWFEGSQSDSATGDTWYYRFASCCYTVNPNSHVQKTLTFGGNLKTTLYSIEPNYLPGRNAYIYQNISDAQSNPLVGIWQWDMDAVTTGSASTLDSTGFENITKAEKTEVLPGEERALTPPGNFPIEQQSFLQQTESKGSVDFSNQASPQSVLGRWRYIVPDYTVRDASPQAISGFLEYNSFSARYMFNIPSPANEGTWQGNTTTILGPYQPDLSSTVNFNVLTRTVPNDELLNATLLNGTEATLTQEMWAASESSDDPIFSCTTEKHYRSVWFKFVPVKSGNLEVNTFGSRYDTVLGIWKGDRGALQNLACNDDTSPSVQSRVSTPVKGGATYYIEIAGFGYYSSGSLTIHLVLNNFKTFIPSIFK
jgi:hypothetical protein